MSGVRKALEAAGEAVRKALVTPPCCMEGTGCELPPCHCSRVAASAAIAAFLRGIADCATQWEAEPGDIPEAWFRDMAAAVEAAAREGA